MTRIANKERDREIRKKKDKEKWTFRKIAKHFNMAVSSVYKAYERDVRLSTGKVLR